MENSLRNEANNMLLFERLLKDHGSRRQISSWYLRTIEPLLMPYDRVHLFRLVSEQNGGMSEVIDINHKGKIYWVKIEQFEIVDDELGETVENIRMMHVKSTNPLNRCALIQIRKGDNVATIKHITKSRPCFTTNRQGTELFDETKAQSKYGDLLMQTVIDYCRSKKTQFGIDRLELSDESVFICGRNEIILEMARQLMGKNPYYMKFGFMPVDRSALETLERNHKIIEPLPAGYPHANLSSIIKTLIDRDDPLVDVDQLLEFLEKNSSTNLTTVMAKIFNWNCMAFYYIYEALFRALRLVRLSENEYELML